jgi:hypothetical protein
MIGLKNAVSMRARVMWVRAFMNTYKRRVIAAGGYIEGEQCAIDKINGNNILKEASWRLIPEGIEEDIVFAQKPTNGTGDLTFTRASDATRTNSAGVIERTPWNLYQFSSVFTNAAWLSGGGGAAVFTDNFATGPSGLFNASRWTAAAIDSQVRQNVATVGTTGTLSVYLRVLSGTKQVRLFINDTVIQQTVTVTTSWQRFTLTGAVGSSLAGAGRVGFSNLSVLTNSDYILVADAQYVEGTDAKPYFATTNRQDVPRLDYRNADGSLNSCPRLLLEPQRTNGIRNSSIVGAVAGSPGTAPTNWAIANAGLTQTVVGIGTESGLQYIDLRFNGNAVTAIVRLNAEVTTQIAATNGQTWSSSCYMKRISGTYDSSTLGFNMRTSGGAGLGAITTPTSLTASLARFVLTATTNQATTAFVQPQIDFLVTPGFTYDFTIRIAAPQMELGAYATTFIPTTTAAVTRLVDAASKTGVSSLIGQTEGTLFFDGIVNNTQNTTSNIFNTNKTPNTISSIALTKVKAISKIKFEQFLGNGTFSNIPLFSTNTFADGARTKVAVRYKSGDFAMYINGVLEATSTSTYTNVGVKSEIYLNDTAAVFAFQESVSFNQAALLTRSLTNSELAQLTTL